MDFMNLCNPVILYLGFSLIQIIIDIFRFDYNIALLKFVVMIIFGTILNILCLRNLTIISWMLVFIPFIFMSVITTLLLVSFKLNPKSFIYFDNDECLDWRIALTSFYSSNIGFISEPLYFYRKHSNQVTVHHNFSQTKMEVVYKAWTTFITSIGIEPTNYSTFSLLATPWNSNTCEINMKELAKTVDQIYNFANQLDPAVSINLKKLVQRRYIFAIRKSKSVSDSMHLLRMGLPQTTKIANDLFRNLIASRVV
jgi:hypothetical protein